jgi:hypothetical protein
VANFGPRSFYLSLFFVAMTSQKWDRLTFKGFDYYLFFFRRPVVLCVCGAPVFSFWYGGEGLRMWDLWFSKIKRGKLQCVCVCVEKK